MSPVPNATIQLTRFLDAHLSEVLKTKQLYEIARDMDLRDVTLRNLSAGRMRLPLDKVVVVANGLNADPYDLMVLALGQFFEKDVIDVILRAGARAYGVDEAAEIADVEHRVGSDVTAHLDEAMIAARRCVSALEAARSVLSEPGIASDLDDRTG